MLISLTESGTCPQKVHVIPRTCGQVARPVDSSRGLIHRQTPMLWTGCGQKAVAGGDIRYKVATLGGGVQRLLFTWVVSSWIWLKASLSLLISLAILAVACMTVEWSLPPKALPIFGSDSSVSSRERYMATWRG